MRVLLATNHILGWTGSELTIATIAEMLSRGGHEVCVYAPFVSGAARANQVVTACSVFNDLSEVVAFGPDVAYTQHHPVALEIRSVLPLVPILHGLLGVLPYLEQLPRRDLAIGVVLAISEEVIAHCKTQGHQQDLEIFRNLVDDELFSDEACPRPLRTVCIYSYKLLDRHRIGLAAAVEERQLSMVDHQPVHGGRTPYSAVPEIVRAGEVIACSGRCAIEAMLSARVPLIVADCGDDGLVMPENFHALMRYNFSGRASGRKLEKDDILEALDGYQPEYGMQLQALAREHFGTGSRMASTVALFERVRQQGTRAIDEAVLRDIIFEVEGFSVQRRFARAAIAK